MAVTILEEALEVKAFTQEEKLGAKVTIPEEMLVEVVTTQEKKSVGKVIIPEEMLEVTEGTILAGKLAEKDITQVGPEVTMAGFPGRMH